MSIFNEINDPLSKNNYSIFSNKGKKLLRKYIKQYKEGGDEGCAIDPATNRCSKKGMFLSRNCELNNNKTRCIKNNLLN